MAEVHEDGVAVVPVVPIIKDEEEDEDIKVVVVVEDEEESMLRKHGSGPVLNLQRRGRATIPIANLPTW